MNYLAHKRHAILSRRVERLRLRDESASTGPFCVLGGQFAKELVFLEGFRHRTEIGRLGVNRWRGAGAY